MREAQTRRQLRSLRQGQVLGTLEAAVELLQLQRAVDGAGLAHLLALAVDAEAGVLALIGDGEVCGGRGERENNTMKGAVE